MPRTVSWEAAVGNAQIAGLHPCWGGSAANIAQQGQNDIMNKRPVEAFSAHIQRRQKMMRKETILRESHNSSLRLTSIFTLFNSSATFFVVSCQAAASSGK